MYYIPHIGYEYHTISWDGMYCIPKMGILSVSREITPFWYEIHTFVLTVYVATYRIAGFFRGGIFSRIHTTTIFRGKIFTSF